MAELNGYNAKELTLKHARLRAEIETLPPGTKAATEKGEEAQRLQADLRRRLYSLLKGDVLPILATAPAATEKKPVISFNFDVFSSLNTRVDRFKIEAPTKKEAMAKAELRAAKYPGRLKVKIS